MDEMIVYVILGFLGLIIVAGVLTTVIYIVGFCEWRRHEERLHEQVEKGDEQ